MSFADINFLFSLSGLVVGILVGLTGVGGGSLMTPVLVLLFNVHPATAVGTDLMYAAATKSLGTLVHGRANSVDWRIVRRLATGSVPATLATFVAMQAFDLTGSKGGTMSLILGVVLLVTAVTLLFRRRIVGYFGAMMRAENEGLVRNLTVITGIILGVTVTLTSVGAGALGVTALLILYPRLPTLKIVGSDIAHAVPLTLVAGLGHWWLGDVDWVLLGSLLIGSLPGIAIGSLLAPRVPEKILRGMLAVVLMLVSLKLILS